MITITKTHLVTDVTAGGTVLHHVPAVRWTLQGDEAVAHLDIVSSTAIVGVGGDRRDIAGLLARLTAMGLDMDVDEDDQRLEWMIGYGGRVWGVASETVLSHCKAALADYETPYPAA